MSYDSIFWVSISLIGLGGTTVFISTQPALQEYPARRFSATEVDISSNNNAFEDVDVFCQGLGKCLP